MNERKKGGAASGVILLATPAMLQRTSAGIGKAKSVRVSAMTPSWRDMVVIGAVIGAAESKRKRKLFTWQETIS